MYSDFANIKISNDIIGLIPLPYCEANGILPLELQNGKLIVLAVDPDSPNIKIAISNIKFKYDIQFVKVTIEQLKEVIDNNFYGKCPKCGKKIKKNVKQCAICEREEMQKAITNLIAPKAMSPPSTPPESVPDVADQQIRCPRCKSTQIVANDKGFGLGKAAVGGLLLGPVGLLGGLIGSKKTMINCLKCGYKWQAGKK